MKKLLLFCCALLMAALFSFTSNAQTSNTVIINEFSQGDTLGSSYDHEWIELVVTADNTDLRGLLITTTSLNSGSNVNPQTFSTSVGLKLSRYSSLSNLSKGAIIVIYKKPTSSGEYDPMLGGTLNANGTGQAPTSDTSFSGDNAILIPSNDPTYIASGSWPGMKNFIKGNTTGDNIGLFDSTGTGIFGITYGDPSLAATNQISGNYGTVTVPDTTSLTSGWEVYWNASDPSTANSYSNWGVQGYNFATPKQLNGGQNGALPVELASFSASVNGSFVNLIWKTATEVNNYGFDVERSSGNSGWQKIGFVSGSGNSNSPKEYSYTDKPSGGTTFSYRLKQIDVNGSSKYYDAVTVNLSVADEPQLLQNSPNPFNPSTTIKFYTPNTSDVTIKIYDILGKEVATLINQQTTAGYHIVYWNGKDSRGENVASGIYLYRLTAGNFSETKKMNLLK